MPQGMVLHSREVSVAQCLEDSSRSRCSELLLMWPRDRTVELISVWGCDFKNCAEIVNWQR